jgi:hypothetical protein
MTPKWYLSRRTILRGAGGAAIALPLLDAMIRPGRARAAEPAKRFLVFFSPGGTVQQYWRPTGTETAFTLPYILAPLEPHKQRLLVVEGLNLSVTSEGFGHPHSRGMGGVLTGQPLNAGPYETCAGKAGFPNGPSIDQVIASKISAGKKFKSLEVAVRWPTDRRDGGKAAPTNQINYQAANQPIPMRTDPQAVYTSLFSDIGGDTAQLAAERARAKSILDGVTRQYGAMIKRLGADDRAKLEAHLTKVREVETSLDAVNGTGVAACKKPDPIGQVVDPTKAMQAQQGAVGSNAQLNPVLDGAMPQVGKLMMDMLTMSLACDLTRVGTMQFSDSQSYNSFPFLNLKENHHAYQHDHGYQPESLKLIYKWYMEQVLYLANALAAIKEGEQSLLDNTAIFVVTEISHPNSHDQKNMPFLVLGNAGGAIKSGRWVKATGQPHNNLLVNLQNAYGIEGKTFGKEKFCTGPIPGIT